MPGRKGFGSVPRPLYLHKIASCIAHGFDTQGFGLLFLTRKAPAIYSVLEIVESFAHEKPAKPGPRCCADGKLRDVAAVLPQQKYHSHAWLWEQ